MKSKLKSLKDKLAFELREAAVICRHEFVNIFTDFGVLIIFFGTIIIYPFLYPYAYSNEVLKNIPVAVVDHDKSSMSRQLIRMLNSNEILNIETKPSDLETAKSQFFHKRVNGVIVIPVDFSKKIFRGEQAHVSAYCDAGYFLVYRQVFKGISLAVGTMSAGIEIKRLMAGGLPEKQARNFIEPLRLNNNFLFNPSGGYASYVMPSVFIVLLQQTLLMGIGMLGGTARERKQFHFFVPLGTQTNKIIPLIFGKGAAYFAIYAFHSVYIFGILFRVFRYPQRGALPDLIIFFVTFLTCVIAMAMAITAFFRNREISIMFVVMTSIPCIILSGFSWPPEAMPRFLRLVSLIIPSTVGVEGFLKISQMGASLSDIRDIIMVLWALTAFYLTLAVMYYRRIVTKFSSYKS